MRGTVTKKGNKWYIVYTIGVVDGKRRQKWESGFKTKRDAELALAKRLVEVGTNTFVEPSNQTLKEFVESWAADKETQVRPTTWRSYEWNLRIHIVPHLGHIRLKDLKAPQIQKFYAILRTLPRADGKPGKISERSILHIHLLLHQILKRAVKWGYIGTNPCDLVDKPHPSDPEFDVWTIDQLKTFLDHAKEPKYVVFLLLFTTGMRIGEVLGLRWQDVNFDEYTLSVKQQITFVKGGYQIGPPKTKAGKRTIDVNQEVITELLKLKAKTESLKQILGEEYHNELDLVCCTDKGTPFYRGNVTASYNEIIKQGRPPLVFVFTMPATHMLACSLSKGKV